jgi:hypothetical protein
MSGDGKTTDDTSAKNAGSDTTGDATKDAQNANQGDKNTSDGVNNDAGGDDKSTKETEMVSKTDYDALFKRMQAADRRATEAEKKNQETADKDLSEAEKAKKAAAKEKEDREAAQTALRIERIQNAFLRSDVTWHDAEDAFAILMRDHGSEVDIDDNGKVTGMDVAVKSLAKKKSHLVKTTADGGSTGGDHNGKRKGEQNDTGKEQRAARFPAAYNRF